MIDILIDYMVIGQTYLLKIVKASLVTPCDEDFSIGIESTLLLSLEINGDILWKAHVPAPIDISII